MQPSNGHKGVNSKSWKLGKLFSGLVRYAFFVAPHYFGYTPENYQETP